MQWRISHKISMLPLVAVLAFGALIATNWMGSRETDQLALNIQNGFYPAVELSRELTDILSKVQRSFESAAASGETSELAATDKLRDDYLVLVASQSGNPVLGPEKLQELKKHFTDYHSLAREATAAYIKDSAASGVRDALAKMQQAYNEVKDSLSLFAKEQRDGMNGALQQSRDLQKRQLQGTFLTAGICILLLILLSVLVIRGVTGSIRGVIQVLKDIAQGEGDLTRRLSIVSKDEMADLAGSFNTFVGRLHQIITDVAGNASQLSDASSALSQSATNVAASAEQMGQQSSVVANASGRVTANVNSMSAGAEQMSASVNTVASAIEEMTASLNEVARNCQNESLVAASANEKANATRQLMEKLGQAAQRIGKVVEVINSIADQTNLLALNATIEAASAGEAGRGFAVVANEVKELARQTAKATEEISREIKDMQTSATGAIKAAGEIATVIEQINNTSQTIVSAVEEQSATINEISKSVGGASSAATDIARNVTDAAREMTQISSNIAGVNQAARGTSADMAGMNQSSKRLADLAAHLNGIVKQFKL